MSIKRMVVTAIIVSVAVSAVAIGYFLFFTHEGAQLVLRYALKKLPSNMRVSCESVQGRLAQGIVCSEVTLSGTAFLPAGTLLRAEKVYITVDIGRTLGLFIEAKNGKVELPNGSVLFFYGNYGSGGLDVNVFTPATSFNAIASCIPRARIPRDVTGRVENIDIFISGHFREPRFTGDFLIPEAALPHLILQDLRCSFDLTLKPAPEKPFLFGEVALSPATAFLRRSVINVRPGKVIFNGDPEKFIFQVRGTAKVEGTEISLALSGTLEKPDFRVTSVPALPQDKLLLMLLTGKSWSETGAAIEKGALSTDVAKDFVDFLFLGGTGASLSERLGVEAVHLTYDARTQGIEIKKALTESASVIYGIKEQRQDAVTQTSPAQTHKVGLEYRLTDKLSVEGSQEFRHLINATQQEDVPPESQIQLKYKKSF